MSNSTSDSPLVQLSFDEEQWRDIPGYEDRYQVSDQGRVWSSASQKILRPRLRNTYPSITLRKSGRKISINIHALVMLTFVGPRPDGFVVDHINRVRTDNRLQNLRYIPLAINSAQAVPLITGEKNPNSKLTDDQRREIVALYQSGLYQQSELADIFGVRFNTVSGIILGRSGSSVTGIPEPRKRERRNR